MRISRALLLWVGLAAGCASPVRAPIGAARVDSSPRRAASVSRCEIGSASATAIRVFVPGREPLVATVREGALTMSPGTDPTVAPVTVSAPLRFRGVLEPAAQRLVLGASDSLAAGAIEAPAGARLLSIESRGRGLEAWLQLGRRDVSSRRGFEVSAGPVHVDCGALRLESDAAPRRASAPPRRTPGAALQIADGALTLRPVRIAPAAVTLRPLIGEVIAAQVVDREGEWARVEVRFDDGALARGWAEARVLREPSEAEAETFERLFAERPAEQHDFVLPEPPAPEPNDATEYVGAARMNANAPVFAAPGEGAWARGPDHPLEVTVRQSTGARWSELLAVPGLELDRPVWVRSDALRLDR